MKEIILDNSLEIVEKDFRILNPQRSFGIDEEEFTLIPESDINIIHRNYLDYLSMCWKNHYGVVISPTILWNMVLGNLAFEVNKNPKTYRKYFTDSDEKKEIIVDQGGNLINVELLINVLNGIISKNIMDDFFPDFTTNTDKSIIANYTSFLDMVSPYYNYGMLLCGIPKIKILGTDEDWDLLGASCVRVWTAIPEFESYLNTVLDKINNIIYNDADFSKFFSLQRCGSGSQVEVNGWITDFFIEQPSINFPENFISCISKIDYKNYNEDGKEYRLFAGLFTSEIEDGYLVPEFNNMYFVKTTE